MSPGDSWDLEKLIFLSIYFSVCERNAPWSSIILNIVPAWVFPVAARDLQKHVFNVFSCVCTVRNCNMFQCECFLAMHQICQSTNPLTHPSASLASLLIWWYSLCHQSTQCICLNCNLSKLLEYFIFAKLCVLFLKIKSSPTSISIYLILKPVPVHYKREWKSI